VFWSLYFKFFWEAVIYAFREEERKYVLPSIMSSAIRKKPWSNSTHHPRTSAWNSSVSVKSRFFKERRELTTVRPRFILPTIYNNIIYIMDLGLMAYRERERERERERDRERETRKKSDTERKEKQGGKEDR
jgi:hypothetical protein